MTNDVLNQVIDDYKVLYHTEKEKRQLLQERIDKAIEYIKEHSTNSYFSMLQADYNMSLDELLEILGGKNE